MNQERIDISPPVLSIARDLLPSFGTVIRAMLKAPLISITYLLALGADWLSMLAGNERLERILENVVGILTIAVLCVLIAARKRELAGEPSAFTFRDLLPVAEVYVVSGIYGAVVYAGTLALIVPGLVFAITGALAAVIVCCEKRNFIEAFDRSTRLTNSRYKQVLAYLWAPASIYVCCSVSLWIVESIATSPLLSQLDESTHAIATNIILICSTFGNLVMLILQFSMMVLQVNLYNYLRSLPGRA